MADGSAADAPADPTADDPGARGTLVIRERVVTRIAAAEALAVDGVVPVSEGLDRVRGRGLPRALAVTRGDSVLVAVRIATRWPAALAAVTRTVQQRVAARIEELTGMHAAQVDVTVERVVAPGAGDAPESPGTRRRVS